MLWWILAIFPIVAFAISDRYSYRAVDPILPIPQLQWENDYSPSNSRTHAITNILYCKPLWKVASNRVIPFDQAMRLELQLVTTPTTTNLGDTQFLDLFCVTGDFWEIGWGPMAIFPTAVHSAKGTGQGKWQLGPALGVLWEFHHTQWGFLAQNPISFAGNSQRQKQNYLLFQPFFFQHLGDGWFLHANPQWTLDWIHQVWKIPLNFGGGRVFQIGDQAFDIDLRIEGMAYENSSSYTPEWTVQMLFSILFQPNHHSAL